MNEMSCDYTSLPDDEACAICLEDGVNHKLKCKHEFHLNCLKLWNKATCPLCREPFELPAQELPHEEPQPDQEEQKLQMDERHRRLQRNVAVFLRRRDQNRAEARDRVKLRQETEQGLLDFMRRNNQDCVNFGNMFAVRVQEKKVPPLSEGMVVQMMLLYDGPKDEQSIAHFVREYRQSQSTPHERVSLRKRPPLRVTLSSFVP